MYLPKYLRYLGICIFYKEKLEIRIDRVGINIQNFKIYFR